MKNLIALVASLILFLTSTTAQQSDSISFYLANYQPVKALFLIEKTIDTTKDSPFLYYQKAKTEKNLSRYSQAIISSQQAINLDSTFLPAWFLQAEIYSFNGFYKKSINSYRYILSIDSLNQLARLNLANTLYKDQQFTAASKLYINLYAQDTTNWYALRQAAQCYEKLQIPAPITLPLYNRVLTINPGDRVSMLRIGNILIALKQYDDAYATTKMFLINDSINTRLLRLNAYAGLHAHKEDSAITSLMKCLSLNDTSFFVYKYLGLCYYGKNDYEPSIEYLEKAIGIDSSDIQTNYFLGSSYGRYVSKAKGIKFLKRTIRLLEPDKEFLSKSYAELGRTYESYYKPRKAKEAYLMAYEFDNTNTELYYLMGYYYYHTLENNNMAEKYLTMYIDSTLAKDNNSYSVRYNRKISENIIKTIKQEEFWEGKREQ